MSARTWGFKSPLRHSVIGVNALVTGGATLPPNGLQGRLSLICHQSLVSTGAFPSVGRRVGDPAALRFPQGNNARVAPELGPSGRRPQRSLALPPLARRHRPSAPGGGADGCGCTTGRGHSHPLCREQVPVREHLDLLPPKRLQLTFSDIDRLVGESYRRRLTAAGLVEQ